MKEVRRCAWAAREPCLSYHDTEWGVPLHDDRTFFEYLILDGAQAGLSWETILKKREGYRRAFEGFDPGRIARWPARKVEALLGDAGIVRNRLKIASAVTNARSFLSVQEEFGSFDAYVWRFVGGEPKVHRRRRMSEIPPRTRESDALSRDLRERGFSFVGSTICYAFMQAAGLVNDHLAGCFRHGEVAKARRRRSTRG